MMRIRKIVSISLCVSAGVAGWQCTSLNVVDLSKQNAGGKEGVYYTLPRTVIQVEVEEKTITRTPGTYASFAKEALGLDNVIKKPEVMEQTGRISSGTLYEPDPQCVYKVEINGNNPAMRKTLAMNLSEAGLLSSFNATAENNAIAVAVGAASTASAIARQFLPLPGGNDNTTAAVSDNPYKYVTPEKSPGSYTRADSLAEARNIVRKIQSLRIRKGELLTGDIRIEGKETIEYMVREIEKMEEEYLSLFAGTQTVSSRVRRHYFTPAQQNMEQSIGNNITVRIQKMANTNADKISKHKISNNGQNGFFYRVPGYARVSISRNGQELFNEQLIVAQYGSVQSLPAKSGLFRSGYQVSFYEGTGAIRSISANTESISPDNVNQLNNTIRGIINEQDELSRLDRERRILEQRRAIQLLRGQEPN